MESITKLNGVNVQLMGSQHHQCLGITRGRVGSMPGKHAQNPMATGSCGNWGAGLDPANAFTYAPITHLGSCETTALVATAKTHLARQVVHVGLGHRCLLAASGSF